jgi:hypothetical protein
MRYGATTNHSNNVLSDVFEDTDMSHIMAGKIPTHKSL